MKIVINDCYGGFGLSNLAIEKYASIKDIDLEARKAKAPFFDDQIEYYYTGTENMFSYRDIARNDSVLVQVVEELGVNANDWGSELKIVDIPEDVKWQIDEYDGIEWVAEQHRTWR